MFTQEASMLLEYGILSVGLRKPYVRLFIFQGFITIISIGGQLTV